MKLFAARRALAGALLLVSCLALAVQCQLAAYSETRSFRDALEGRSMEEAISGPVDKDTSSYGDRTAPDAASAAPAANMMNIPANGNLNQQQQQQQSQTQTQMQVPAGGADDQQQQQKFSGPELEREAGPIGANYPMDTQQQSMEQMARAKQMRMARAGRLAGRMGSGRLQQAKQEPLDGPTLGDESAGKQRAAGSKYAAAAAPAPFGQQEQQMKQADSYGQSMAPASGDEQQQQEKSYDGAADGQQQQQPSMAAKQMKMAGAQMMPAEPMDKLMKRARASNRYAAGQEQANGMMRSMQPSGMAQSMMMSLANKAAYMANRGQQAAMSQRQLAPPMMQPEAGAYGGPARPMRRANQRKPEKKISPAMMNAMLNRMLAGRAEAQEGAGSYGAGGAMRPQMGGAEMLANMMVMSANGAGQMSAAKKDQYKRMLMRAIMQQQQQMTMAGGEEEPASEEAGSPATSNKYGDRAKPMGMGANGAAAYDKSAMSANQMAANPSMAASYEAQQQQQQKMMMMMMMPRQQQQMAMENGQQKMDSMLMEGQQREVAPGEMAGAKPMRAARTNGYGNQMARGMGSMTGLAGAYGTDKAMQAMQAMQMMMKNKMYGASGQQQEKEMESQQQQQQGQEMPMSGAYGGQMNSDDKMDMPMNGFRQAYNGGQQQQMADGAKEQQTFGQSQQREMSPAGKLMPPAPSRPVSMIYGNQGQADSTKGGQQADEQQQQQDDGYGAAPMGQAEPFAFNYKTQDNYGNEQYRKEESDKNGVVRGSYGYMDQSGIFRHVEYVADENGFRANVKSNEPGLSGEQGQSSAPGVSTKGAGQATGPGASGEMPMPMPMPMDSGAGQMAPPPSSSSSLAGSSGTGDASLRLQQQQQQQDTQLPMTPVMDMSYAMQKAAGQQQQQQPEREMQQQQKPAMASAAYGGMSDNGSGVEN